ncbi:tetratricopeptide repeat protein [Microbaculum marinum]|uniref:Tetratricopeptide repeat protein n=1 Tax=Microbaculum marinum TaxID=1764581 RepID=A0AAW9RWI1_9HYPH
MRTFSLVAAGVMVTAAFAAQPARALDPSLPLAPDASPIDAFRMGAELYSSGDRRSAFNAFEFAASKGHAIAQWKLGKMYADGDGVEEDDYKAFQMFSAIADQHADDNPYTPSARVVADAFVNLANYYKTGIANAGIQPDVGRALGLFTHAATYFGDADAQYNLAKIYLNGDGIEPDPVRAVRWLSLAARKNHVEAQAALGEVLVFGEGVRPLPEKGYMWIAVARENATPKNRDWILALDHRARQVLTDKQIEVGTDLAASWVEKQGS